jgi:PAS domain S-box-containing protein
MVQARRTEDKLAKVERLQAEAKAAAQRYRDLVEGIDAIVWEATAADMQFSFVSQRAEDILGYPVERWLTTPEFFAQLIHPHDRERVLALARAAAEQGHDHTLEFRALAADGHVVWLRSRARVVCDAAGRPQLLRGLMVDITALMQSEEARRQLSAVLEATTDFVGITDLRGRILYLNGAGRKLLGIGATAEVSTLNAVQYQPEDVRRLICEVGLPTAMRDGVWSGETRLLIDGGRQIPISQVIVAPKTASGTVEFFATIGRDISERQRSEERTAALLEIAKDINGSFDLHAILDRVQRRTAALLPCDHVVTYYWEPLRSTFRNIAYYGMPPARRWSSMM